MIASSGLSIPAHGRAKGEPDRELKFSNIHHNAPAEGVMVRYSPSMNRLLFATLTLVFLTCGSEDHGPTGETKTAQSTSPQTTPSQPTPATTAAPEPPRVGDLAPDFTLTDQSGKVVPLSASRGQNVVLVFYRGHW